MVQRKPIKVIKRSDLERLRQELGLNRSVELGEKEKRRLTAANVQEWVTEFRTARRVRTSASGL